MNELKPCPFCGDAELLNIIQFKNYAGKPMYYVRCNYCRTDCGSYPSKKQAIDAWNRRAASETDDYIEGVKYAIYEIFKEADISGSQEIRDSGDTDDGMCARAAERIRAELTAAPENKPLKEQLAQASEQLESLRIIFYEITGSVPSGKLGESGHC